MCCMITPRMCGVIIQGSVHVLEALQGAEYGDRITGRLDSLNKEVVDWANKQTLWELSHNGEKYSQPWNGDRLEAPEE